MKNKIIGFSLFTAACVLTLAMKVSFTTTDTYKAVDLSNFDNTVRPQDDFYQYVNGNWIKKNPIPSTETTWGNFNVLNEKSLNALHKICDDASKNKGAMGSNTQKIGDFYSSGMDSASIEAQKFTPIQPMLDKINEMKDKSMLSVMIGKLHKVQANIGFSFFVMADMKD